MNVFLTVCQCSKHKFTAIAIDSGNTGTRITPSKCCGTWDKEISKWKMDERQLREIIVACENAIEDLGRE